MSDEPRGPHVPIYLSMDDPEPMYAQIESQFRDFILAGVLPPGTRLPSMRALARNLTCSVITTRRAYENLEGEGLIRTRQGLGTVVADIPEEMITARRREPVEKAFKEAVRAGGRAGFDGEELRHIMEEALQAEGASTDQSTTRRSKP